MFTLSDISTAHAQVKSGADFPAYARSLIAMWVTAYDTYVSDGHAVYLGNPESITSPAKYDTLTIANNCNREKFIERLKLHQSGGTDYMSFCQDCAENGIEKWTLDMSGHTCTYYDISRIPIHTEHFPE
jgi:uncharacterized protein YbcV (DUF1398 family)